MHGDVETNGRSSVLAPGIAQELIYELKVARAMRTDVITIPPDTTMNEVRNVLREHRISGTVVSDDSGMVGIVSIEDLIEALVSGQMDATVREKMSSPVRSLYADEPLVHAVNTFAQNRYGRFPVIDRKTGQLVGIITKGDIVRCLLRKLEKNHDEYERDRYRPGHVFDDILSDRSELVMRHAIKGANFEAAGQASSRLKKNLLKLGIPPEVARRITIASYEAEINMVIFTPGGELIATVDPEKVVIEAVDNGPGIPDVDQAMKPGFSTAPDWVRELGFGAGMGLPNIKKCSDAMVIDSRIPRGTSIHFTVYTNA